MSLDPYLRGRPLKTRFRDRVDAIKSVYALHYFPSLNAFEISEVREYLRGVYAEYDLIGSFSDFQTLPPKAGTAICMQFPGSYAQRVEAVLDELKQQYETPTPYQTVVGFHRRRRPQP